MLRNTSIREGVTDLRTGGRTDGRTLLYRCFVAPITCLYLDITLRLCDDSGVAFVHHGDVSDHSLRTSPDAGHSRPEKTSFARSANLHRARSHRLLRFRISPQRLRCCAQSKRSLCLIKETMKRGETRDAETEAAGHQPHPHLRMG